MRRFKDEVNSESEKVSVSAGVIIFRRTEEGIKYLLLYHGGPYWNFPKGKIAEGEKSFKAALREVEEETGIKSRDLRFVNSFKFVDKFVFYTKDKKRIPRVIIYYLAETSKADVVIKSKEHQGYAWFLFKDALRFLKAVNLKNHLKKAHSFILKRENLVKL
jgi:8-oxo-dGTP pyrophosphatase MutT (NUDIX family)